MSDYNPYETLRVTEGASFEEIQEARDRLVQDYSSDPKQVEAVETAYDAILMDRLRLRQEGKIKVPDRIRFPEKLTPAPPKPAVVPPTQGPSWLQRLIDTPSRTDVLWPAACFGGLGVLGIFSPALALALGVAVSLYFLNRKENKFGRAILLTLIGSIVGIVVGLQVYPFLADPLQNLSVAAESFAALITFVLLWVISSFLR